MPLLSVRTNVLNSFLLILKTSDIFVYDVTVSSIESVLINNLAVVNILSELEFKIRMVDIILSLHSFKFIP